MEEDCILLPTIANSDQQAWMGLDPIDHDALDAGVVLVAPAAHWIVDVTIFQLEQSHQRIDVRKLNEESLLHSTDKTKCALLICDYGVGR